MANSDRHGSRRNPKRGGLAATQVDLALPYEQVTPAMAPPTARPSEAPTPVDPENGPPAFFEEHPHDAPTREVPLDGKTTEVPICELEALVAGTVEPESSPQTIRGIFPEDKTVETSVPTQPPSSLDLQRAQSGELSQMPVIESWTTSSAPPPPSVATLLSPSQVELSVPSQSRQVVAPAAAPPRAQRRRRRRPPAKRWVPMLALAAMTFALLCLGVFFGWLLVSVPT